MNDPAHDFGLLRRELRDTRAIASNIDVKLRQLLERPRPPSPAHVLAKALACHVLGARHSQPAAAVAAAHYRNDPDVLAALAAPGLIGKAAHAPAMTTQSGWAAELAIPRNVDLDFAQLLATTSIYSQLSQFPGAIRVDLSGASKARIPGRASGSLAPAFVAEGAPIPVKQITLGSADVEPRKAVVISAFTREMLKGSIPSVQNVIAATVRLDAVAIDGVLLGSAAGSAIQPPGLLNSVTPTTATAGGGLNAFAQDLRNLAAAIEATGPLIAPVLIMSSTSSLLVALLSQGGAADMPILAAPSVPAKRLIMVDASNFASGEGDTPAVIASNEALVHEDDSAQPIGAVPAGTTDRGDWSAATQYVAGDRVRYVPDGKFYSTATPVLGTAPPAAPWTASPAVTAAPARSYWQTDCVALKFVQDVGWNMSRAGRVAYVDTVSW